MKKTSNEVIYYSKSIKEIIQDLEFVELSLSKLGVEEDTLAKLKVIKMKIRSLIELNKGKLK